MKTMMRNWDIFRLTRLISGGGMAIYGIYTNDRFFIILGVLLALMAITNLSCCAAGGCGTSTTKPKAVYKDLIETYKPGNNKTGKQQ